MEISVEPVDGEKEEPKGGWGEDNEEPKGGRVGNKA